MKVVCYSKADHFGVEQTDHTGDCLVSLFLLKQLTKLGMKPQGFIVHTYQGRIEEQMIKKLQKNKYREHLCLIQKAPGIAILFADPRGLIFLYEQKVENKTLATALDGISMFNAKSKAAEITKILEKFIPDVEKMSTEMKKYRTAFAELKSENTALVEEKENLTKELNASKKEGIHKKLKDAQLQHDYNQALELLDRIPPDILSFYAGRSAPEKKRGDYHIQIE